ncbi:AAA family ATPase [Rhizobium gallicum]|nr:AAA family ATPase [Rhizobium gallicum]
MAWLSDVRDAAHRLKTADRVLVIGCSGGGKTTLARTIATRFSLPFISMDREFFWLPGWVARARPQQRALIAERIKRDRWIMDGTNTSSFDLRLPRADIVLWVRMPRLICVWGAVSRWLKWIGRTRPEMTPGCPEKVDLEFLRYIWNFEKKHSPMVLAAMAAHGPDVPVLQLKSRHQMRELLDLLGSPA